MQSAYYWDDKIAAGLRCNRSISFDRSARVLKPTGILADDASDVNGRPSFDLLCRKPCDADALAAGRTVRLWYAKLITKTK